MIVSSYGNINGTFNTSYGGNPPKIFFLYVLFMIIETKYLYAGYGGYSSHTISNLLPLIAQKSVETSATFRIKGTFNIPSTGIRSEPLSALEVNFTWVRVYKIDNILYHQILPRDGYRYPDIPTISFNMRPSTVLKNRFGHYSAMFQERELYYKGVMLPEIILIICTWIKKNVLW